jgi:hypothetical protein
MIQARFSLINHIGIRLGDEPEEILDKLDRNAFGETVLNTPRADLRPITNAPCFATD